MKKQKIKVKEIKSKVKIISSITNNPPSQSFQQPVHQERHIQTIEEKTKSSALPLLKNEENGIREIQLPSKPRQEQPKDKEHIFTSYDRFGMSGREKARVYSQDLRSGAGPTSNIPTLAGSSEQVLRQARGVNDNARFGGGRVLVSDESSNINPNELSKYQAGPGKYHPKKNEDLD